MVDLADVYGLIVLDVKEMKGKEGLSYTHRSKTIRGFRDNDRHNLKWNYGLRM